MDQEKGACGGRLQLGDRPCPPLGLHDLVLPPGFLPRSSSMKISRRGLDKDQAGGSCVAGAVSWSVGPSVAGLCQAPQLRPATEAPLPAPAPS